MSTRATGQDIVLNNSEKIVVLGRRQAGEYETEPGFIACIEKKIRRGGNTVVPEKQFIDGLYPWFEPRTAPLQLGRMAAMLAEPLIRDRLVSTGVRYMIWVDGNTETLNREGAMGCSITPGGGGCFGFTSWDKDSRYEATIWDLEELAEEGQVRVDSNGTSYLIAVGAPIPFIAQVQAQACDGIGSQLRDFFSDESSDKASEEG